MNIKNKELCEKYPWLITRDIWTNKPLNDPDYNFIILDSLPKGWKIAFGEQICEEIQKVLEEGNFVDDYRVIRINDKCGFLHWYDSPVPLVISDKLYDIIRKYEKISAHTCIECGAPATKVSTGLVRPYCDECVEKKEINFLPIEKWDFKI